MEELFQLLRAHLEKAAEDGVYVSSCVLSGGGSQLLGAVEVAQEVLEMPVRVGRPRDVIDPRDLVDSPVYATAVGLLQFAGDRRTGRKRIKQPRSLAGSAFRLLTAWFGRRRR
jgi:cell division protein FtsA